MYLIYVRRTNSYIVAVLNNWYIAAALNKLNSPANCPNHKFPNSPNQKLPISNSLSL